MPLGPFSFRSNERTPKKNESSRSNRERETERAQESGGMWERKKHLGKHWTRQAGPISIAAYIIYFWIVLSKRRVLWHRWNFIWDAVLASGFLSVKHPPTGTLLKLITLITIISHLTISLHSATLLAFAFFFFLPLLLFRMGKSHAPRCVAKWTTAREICVAFKYSFFFFVPFIWVSFINVRHFSLAIEKSSHRQEQEWRRKKKRN